MSAPALQQSHTSVESPAPVSAQWFTAIIILLAAVASGFGFFLPTVYRDSPNMVAQAVGQDMVTLFFAIPALLVTLVYVRRGSARARLIWIGLLAYMLYTYTTMAFGAAFNKLFLVYVALFSLSICALIATLGSLAPATWPARFDAGTPRRAVAGFIAFVGLMVLGLWLPEVLRYLVTGQLPPSMVLADIPTNFVYVLDLGVIVPLAFLTSTWLWKRQPWGVVLAGVLLAKAVTMGLALISMVWFMARGGQPIDLPPTVMALVVTTGGLGFSVWFFRHCRD